MTTKRHKQRTMFTPLLLRSKHVVQSDIDFGEKVKFTLNNMVKIWLQLSAWLRWLKQEEEFLTARQAKSLIALQEEIKRLLKNMQKSFAEFCARFWHDVKAIMPKIEAVHKDFAHELTRLHQEVIESNAKIAGLEKQLQIAHDRTHKSVLNSCLSSYECLHHELAMERKKLSNLKHQLTILERYLHGFKAKKDIIDDALHSLQSADKDTHYRNTV